MLLYGMSVLTHTHTHTSCHYYIDLAGLNMLMDPTQSLATLVGNLQPIQIYFPAYQGTQMLQTVRVFFCWDKSKPTVTMPVFLSCCMILLLISDLICEI